MFSKAGDTCVKYMFWHWPPAALNFVDHKLPNQFGHIKRIKQFPLTLVTLIAAQVAEKPLQRRRWRLPRLGGLSNEIGRYMTNRSVSGFEICPILELKCRQTKNFFSNSQSIWPWNKLIITLNFSCDTVCSHSNSAA